LKSFTLSLREQLRPTNITVVEISPPLVESDLLRDHQDLYTDKAKTYNALTQDEWMATVEKAWDAGAEEIGAQFSQMVIDKWRATFGELHAAMASQ
jgi:short-subunit dehydrogenase involved in D-alanine esterification of teichoic acids